ncbi:short chain dehydrogenase [Dactylonectria macrodidyma]|uniref:Short chain dehydrogenase n=1 Tax=Dactylonectria macrodidyma TaxID=307937 RepID=A0A9P9EVI2_9HYPO|nr:short chain dehydrogenase [Dactylonectria macrodidyma]
MASGSKRVIVVTGASRGLGLEWVEQLSQNSENFVIALVRNPDTAERLKPLLGPQVVAVKGDVSDFDSFPRVVENISKVGGGKVDWLINNAGVMAGTGAEPMTGISKSTVKEWEDQFKINVLGLVFFTIALIPLLEKGSEKKVVNVSSMLGDLNYTEKNPNLHFSSYSATKAAVTMANAKFHLEFRDKGFVFLALNPGWVKTELGPEEVQQYAPLTPYKSISRCLSFVYRSNSDDSGKFWSLDGLKEAVTD